MHASICFPYFKLLKFGISKYLYLCVESRFSQVRSHMHAPTDTPKHTHVHTFAHTHTYT